jgi:hypothetical protein
MVVAMGGASHVTLRWPGAGVLSMQHCWQHSVLVAIGAADVFSPGPYVGACLASCIARSAFNRLKKVHLHTCAALKAGKGFVVLLAVCAM